MEREFAYVRADAEAGLAEAKSQAAIYERLSARAFAGEEKEALEVAGRLRALKLGEAFIIEFGDGPAITVSTALIPGDAMMFGYGSEEEQNSVQHLVERCARALDCDVILI